MARGENLFRQWDLIKVLQANRFGISYNDIAKHLECTRRTVERDLRMLQDIFPICSERGERGKLKWKLAHDAIKSEQFQLTPTEMMSLLFSQQLLLPLAGTQFGDGLQTALQKIRSRLPTPALAYFENLEASFFVKHLANHDYSKIDKEIRILNKAIFNQTKVEIAYRTAGKSKAVTSEFEPYGMVLLHASLYCIGYIDCYQEICTLKVSRVQSVKCLQKTFKKPKDFSLANYFKGSLGVFHAKGIQTFQVAFFDWAATSVREMQWHTSQTITKDANGKLVATFELSNTIEFKRWLLGFGRCAQVLSPKSFVDEIREELQAAAKSYGDD